MDAGLFGTLMKKINGLASGVASSEVVDTSLVFHMTDGTTQTITFTAPKDGKNGSDGANWYFCH